MPTSVGPNTFGQENLVFGYDLGDTVNSYKGEPTTNFMPNIYRDGSNITAGTDSIGNYFQGTITRIGCPNGTSINSGATYTFSIELRSDTTFNMSADSNQYTPEFPTSNDTSRASVSYVMPNYTTPGKWVKYSTTVVMKSGLTNPTMFDFFMPQSFTGRLYYRNAQLEYKPHATQFTPSGTTRSATQGLLDLTGNSTIDLSNVSFDSNAQMTFDGTNDQILLDSYASTIPYGTSVNITVETFTRWNDLVPNGVIVSYGGNGTGAGFLFQVEFSQGLEFSLFDGNGNGGRASLLTAPSAQYEDQYIHMVGTYDGNTVRLYINGTQSASQAYTYGYPQQSYFRLGNEYNRSYYANIDLPVLKIYNRALTASEIKSNFNAIKGRFNI